jgi:hypothetical protein
MSASRSGCCEKNGIGNYVDLTANKATSRSMEFSRRLAQIDAEELRNLTATPIAQLSEREAQVSERYTELNARAAQLASHNKKLKRKQLKIDHMMLEMVTLKRWRYGRHSEQLDAVQHSRLAGDRCDARYPRATA